MKLKSSLILVFTSMIMFFAAFIHTQDVKAYDFNGTVDNEDGQRLSPPSVQVECVSNCNSFRWVDNHWDARFDRTGTVSIRVSDYPNEYVGCRYDIVDRGPDYQDTSDDRVIKSDEGCVANFNAAYTNIWRYAVLFTIIKPPEPELQPCKPYLESPTYKCNEDETAKVTWKWTPVPPSNSAEVYLLQVAFDRDFNNIDRETLMLSPDTADPGKLIGSINSFTNNSVNEPDLLRYSRVRVFQSSTACESGGDWEWSNVTTNLEFCYEDDKEKNERPETKFLTTYFCDNSGEPTEDPSSGKIYSAIGCLPAIESQSFIEFVLRWSIPVGGGLALLLTAYAGVLYMSSRGDPRKVQAAKELLTAAVGGLIFLILSASILRIVSCSILGLESC